MEPQRIQGIAQAQWSALRKALSYARVSRFASVAEFLRALDGNPSGTEVTHSLPVVEESRTTSPWWRILVAVVVMAAVGLALQLSGTLSQLAGLESDTKTETSRARNVADNVENNRGLPDEPNAASAESIISPEPFEADSIAIDGDQAAPRPPIEEVADQPASDVKDALPLTNFSSLPQADLVLSLGTLGARLVQAQVEMTEDSLPVALDIVRRTDIGLPLSLRLEEVSYSGNRSPWESGQ
jgi:hypothetical protein